MSDICIEVRRVGLIEIRRSRSFRWADGYAVFVDGRETFPWVRKREADSIASRIRRERKDHVGCHDHRQV